MDDLISRFMEKTRIDEIYSEHIRKGAYLAQDHSAFDDLREDALTLKPEERSALRMEDPKTGNKWNQPWILVRPRALTQEPDADAALVCPRRMLLSGSRRAGLGRGP